MTLTLEVELPDDLDRFHLPEAVAARLQHLLDRQDAGQPLTPEDARRQKDWSTWRSSLHCYGCGQGNAFLSHVQPDQEQRNEQ